MSEDAPSGEKKQSSRFSRFSIKSNAKKKTPSTLRVCRVHISSLGAYLWCSLFFVFCFVLFRLFRLFVSFIWYVSCCWSRIVTFVDFEGIKYSIAASSSSTHCILRLSEIYRDCSTCIIVCWVLLADCLDSQPAASYESAVATDPGSDQEARGMDDGRTGYRFSMHISPQVERRRK